MERKIKTVLRLLILMMLVVMLVCLLGCGSGKIDEQKVTDIDYTVTSEDRLPAELKELIDQKKEAPFKMTYQDGEYLYICQGYGSQPTGGYSIQVGDVYRTSNAIYFSTTLIGPSGNEPGTDLPTCPYVVVKIEYQDLTVVFE